MTHLSNIYKALTSHEELTALLANGANSIYHQNSPEAGKLPLVVYSLTGDNPALFGDNAELASVASVRIHIVTKDGGYFPIYNEVWGVMKGLGFMRSACFETYISGEKVFIIDFKIGVES